MTEKFVKRQAKCALKKILKFARGCLEAGRLASILSRVKPKTLKLVSAVTLAKRSAIKCSAEDEINRE